MAGLVGRRYGQGPVDLEHPGGVGHLHGQPDFGSGLRWPIGYRGPVRGPPGPHSPTARDWRTSARGASLCWWSALRP